jgi:hypothetical protein
MSTSRQYRITSPTIAIFSYGGERTTVTLPAEAIVRVSVEPQAGDQLIDVLWNGNKYLMFAQDLRDRAERIED